MDQQTTQGVVRLWLDWEAFSSGQGALTEIASRVGVNNSCEFARLSWG